MANMGQRDFEARIKRIKNPRNNSYYDPDLQMHIPNKVARAKIVKPPSKGNKALTAFLVSMVIGSVAMFCAQILRVIDALQAGDKNGVATPADWKVGDKVIIPPSVSNEEAARKFPQGFDEIRPYLRFTDVG